MDLEQYVQAGFERLHGATVGQLRDWFMSGVRHGCWCGPGNTCSEEQDGLDSACRRHDEAYGAVGVNTSDGVSMWTPDGFWRTREADRALVNEAQGLQIDNDEYRQRMIWLFSTRADIGDWVDVICQRWEEFRQWLPSLASMSSDEARSAIGQWSSYLAQVGAEQEELLQAAAAEGYAPPGDGDTAYA